MKKLYKKNELYFSLLWIILYCVFIGSVRANYGDASPIMALSILIYAAALLYTVLSIHLQKKTGLDHWPKDQKKYLYFIPMWILCTGNLWGGFGREYEGMGQVYATVTMLTVGFVEEMIFRGFLFNALLKEQKELIAIIISSLTFGMGHIINLFTGQASFDTVIQVFFAVAWGFIFTMVYYTGGSLLPCIFAHSLIDVFSLYNRESDLFSWIFIISTIVVAIIYCTYLYRIKKTDSVS